MGARRLETLTVGVLLAVTAGAVRAEPPDRALADAGLLLELCAKHCSQLEMLDGSPVFTGGPPAEAEAALDALDAVAETVRAAPAALEQCAARYGETGPEVAAALTAVEVPTATEAGSAFVRLRQGLVDLQASRRTSAARVVRQARSELSEIAYFIPRVRLEKMSEARELLEAGHGLDPTNPLVNSLLLSLDRDITAMTEVPAAELERGRWEGHVTSFAGPGTVDELAAAALGFFRHHSEWGADADRPTEVLAVAVRGDWQPAATDELERPRSWRLPLHVAVTDPAMEAAGTARLYSVDAVTAEGGGPSPPFATYWFDGAQPIRLGKVP